MDEKIVKMDEDGLVDMLNLIFDESTEDRTFAIDNYKALRDRFAALTPQEFGAVESAIGLSDVAESMERFLKASTGSIDKQLKVAKIVADALLFKNRLDASDSMFSDDDRNDLQDNIAELIKNQKKEIDTPLTLVRSEGE